MKTNELRVNLSTFGLSATGIGVYSNYCAKCIDNYFDCSIVSSNFISKNQNKIIRSPKIISISKNKFSPILRIIYSIIGFPRSNTFVYSPSHHGLAFYKNQVITIHDLICLDYPEQHKLQYYFFKKLLPYYISQSRAIFTVSEFTKKRIIETYHVEPKNVHIVPNCIDVDYFKPKNNFESKDHDKFLLVIGASFFHKNIHELLSVSNLWSKKYKLKIVSSGGNYRSFLEGLANKYQISDAIEFLGYVTDSEILDLYHRCTALIYPSLIEGFGIPPLEAMASKRPVIASNIPVHHEVLGDSPIYVDLGDVNSWQEAFTLLENSEYIESKINNGFIHASLYTFEYTCQKLVNSLVSIEPLLKNHLK